MSSSTSRVLVCGGRAFHGPLLVKRVLDSLQPRLIIHGGARGADTLAGEYAEKTGTPCMAFPAPWSSKGRAAGPIRNAWMLEFGRPDLVVAFPGGRGTEDMVTKAERAGIRVMRVKDDG